MSSSGSVRPAPTTKRSRPTISRPGDRADPFWVATESAEGSSTFKMCLFESLPIKGVEKFVLLALSNRCRTEKPLRGGVMHGGRIYIVHANYGTAPSVLWGSVDDFHTKMVSILGRKGTFSPNKGRFSLKVYAGALGVNLPIWHPCIMAVMRAPRKRGIRQDPPPPWTFFWR